MDHKLLLLLTLLLSMFHLTMGKENIYIAGLFPLNHMTSSVELTELAIEQINADPNILPEHNLVIYWSDKPCNHFPLYSIFYYYDNVTFASVFGLPCLYDMYDIPYVLPKYNTMMMTFSEHIPDFSFPNFFYYYDYGDSNYSKPTPFVIEGFPSELSKLPAQIKFINDNKWTRVAVVRLASESSDGLSYMLRDALTRLDITTRVETISISTTSGDDDNNEGENDQFDYVIDALMNDNYRIIIFNTDHKTIYQVFCRIANRSLDFKEYTFILPEPEIAADRDKSIWNNELKKSCALNEVLELVTGSIGFLHYVGIQEFLNLNHTSISANISTPQQILRDFILNNGTRENEHSHVIGPYMYDAMWALAKGLNETILQGSNPNLPYYDTERSYFTESLYENVLRADFKSFTGKVAFMGDSRASPIVQLIEYTNDSYEFRGLYTNLPYELSNLDNFSQVQLINETEFIYWTSGSDGVETYYSHISIFILVLILSIFTTIYIVAYIIIILCGVYKKLPPAIHSEPAMSVFILLSNLFWIAFSILLTIDGKFTPFTGPPLVCSIYCHLIVWLGFTSLSLILGGVLAKSIKLYALWVLNRFQRKSRDKLRFHYLILLPLSLCIVDTIIILLSYAIRPIEYDTEEVLSDVMDPPIYLISFCDFRLTWFLGILIVIKVVLISICVFLAYHLRNVTHKSQRYSFIIGLIMYTTVFFAILIMFVLGYIPDYDTKIALSAIFGVLSSVITSTITGLPTVVYMIRDPTGKNLFECQNVDTFPEDNSILKRRINALEKDLEKVTSQFETYSNPMTSASLVDPESLAVPEKTS